MYKRSRNFFTWPEIAWNEQIQLFRKLIDIDNNSADQTLFKKKKRNQTKDRSRKNYYRVFLPLGAFKLQTYFLGNT